ncbi:MAG: hypothetical protein JWO85_945 [Candidatus Eremiobacteraeota bacterium]|nr:hypothetical protein [Candidatus Eremiobacteraeota bacterium]
MQSSQLVRAACVLSAFALSACGGGGTKSVTPTTSAQAPGTTQSPTTASTSFATSTASSTHDLAPAGGFTGAISLTGASAASTMTATSSTIAPDGAYTQSSVRSPQSGTLTFYFYVTLATPITVTFTGLPGFSLTLPSTIPTTGRSFFYAISDPTIKDVTLAFRTEGPAVVSGQNITFAPSANPITLQAGQKYVVTFYATSLSGTVPVTTIAVPNVPPATGTWSFDISAVDPSKHAYYLADRTNFSLDIVDTNATRLVAQIPGFVGFTGDNATSGPDGVVPIPGTNTVYVGDGKSQVQVVDVSTRAITKTISTAIVPGDLFRSDEGSYDPDDKIVAFANNADTPPFITFISTATNQVLAHYVFTGASGVEQSQYDPTTKLFFVNVVGTPANPGGEVDTFDPATVLAKAPVVKSRYPLTNCAPTGMAVGLNDQLLIGCDPPSGALTTIVLDAATGTVVKTFTQVGGSDEVWFNPGNNRFYTASRTWTKTGIVGGPPAPVLGVIDAATLTFIQNVPTETNAHSVAADPVTNHIFVPLPTKGIGVYSGF